MALYAFAGSLTQPAPHFAAANGEGISVFRFDDEAGTLTAIGAPLRVEDASWIVAGKGGSLYATTETPDHRQSALAA
ncbi:MAG: beta-propeller fold lactonase family protein, partial [Devosia nanyangense]|nr:beta-propeller fold lactonase family protein [Devosia nanyangense]